MIRGPFVLGSSNWCRHHYRWVDCHKSRWRTCLLCSSYPGFTKLKRDCCSSGDSCPERSLAFGSRILILFINGIWNLLPLIEPPIPEVNTPSVKSLFETPLLLAFVEERAPGLAGLFGAVPGLWISPPEWCLILGGWLPRLKFPNWPCMSFPCIWKALLETPAPWYCCSKAVALIGPLLNTEFGYCWLLLWGFYPIILIPALISLNWAPIWFLPWGILKIPKPVF